MTADPSSEPPFDSGPGRRRLGFTRAELGTMVDLPDDVEALAAAIEAGGQPFNGAFVPVVLHDPLSAERSYDAAEWAADLIRSAAGPYLAVLVCGNPAEGPEPELNARQWNHAAAMMERLEGVGQRFGLAILVRDTVDDVEVGTDNVGVDRPIHHLLDTGRYLADGLVPVRLTCPEAAGRAG